MRVFPRKLLSHVAIILLAVVSAFGTLKGLDVVLDRYGYRILMLDETFRPGEFADTPFIVKQYFNHILSPEICRKYRHQIVIFGSSETSGAYEPYDLSPSAELNRLLPSDVIAFNSSVDGHWLHSQWVIQTEFLRRTRPDCHPIVFYGINQRTYDVEPIGETQNFYGNFQGDFRAKDMADHRVYNGLSFRREFSNVIGLIRLMQRPRRGAPIASLWDILLEWKSLVRADSIYRAPYLNYTKTLRWYEQGWNCDNVDVSSLIRKSRQRNILDDLIAQFQAAGVPYYFYLHPHSPFPEKECQNILTSQRAFKDLYPQATPLNRFFFNRESYIDGWHMTEVGDAGLAQSWFQILKEKGVIQ